MNDILSMMFCAAMIAGTIIFIGEKFLSMPVVHWSYTQDKCVKVISLDDNYTCDNLPEKYERLWVQ